jgi:hypothetical protein
MQSKKEYIGDSVYVSFDGYHIVLTTENGLPGDPSNTIALEPSVFKSLCEYEKRLYARKIKS